MFYVIFDATLPIVYADYMSLIMRKPAFCICENKDADQLRGNREADQRLCFRNPSAFYIQNFKPLAILSGFTARFVPDLVGNPEDRFSHSETHIKFGWGS